MTDLADSRIGITTTIPVEIVYAAGLVPVDLNNRFITSPEPGRMVERAEHAGFPRTVCAWIKGIYAAVGDADIRRLIAVARGDCSNTHALAEILETEGVEIIDFSFPYRRDALELDVELDKLCDRLGTARAAAEIQKGRLDAVRRTVREIDRLTWDGGRVTGEENHRWQINCSDFRGDSDAYGDEAARFLEAARRRDPTLPAAAEPQRRRVGILGIPPICSDLHATLDAFGLAVVFNEMQRQFAMPYDTPDLLEQYRRYTYPYDVFYRLDDIRREIARRGIGAVVHVVQSFCHRGIQDRLVRDALDVPVLTLECDRPGPLDGRSRTRLEAFAEMLTS
jgi:benzoyl-CoA reductase/2-hydroxyglutaryl-CoA dehydratase subunit BcrC/BadD/HgdB